MAQGTGWRGEAVEGAGNGIGCDAASEAGPASVVRWDQDLTRRMRVLLHTFPLHDLHSGDSKRDQELRHYDSLALAVKVFDLIVDSSGLDREVNRDVVERTLSPLLSEMDKEAGRPPSLDRHAEMVDRVLAKLRNDSDSRRPFEVVYCDFDEHGRPVRRKLEFRLVVDHFHPAGGVVLRLSTEAINLYLNALELDIEDAQAAAEAVVQSQLARGKFAEAVQSARNARWQSLRYQGKVAGIMRETRRDVCRVDWGEEVPRLLEEALAHIQIRLATEESILTTAEERLDVLPQYDEGVRAITEVTRLIRDCRLRHVDLHDQLMRARNIFLDEQARQAFAPSPLQPLPELRSDVLEPVLRFDRDRAALVLDRGFGAFFGGRAPSVVSLAELVSWLLRPRRELPAREVPVQERDLTRYDSDFLRYPPDVRARVEALLARIDSPVTLSSLLRRAEDEGAPQPVLELIALMALHYYAPEEAGAAPIRVEKRSGEYLRTAGFFGDELELGRREVDDGS